MEASGGFLKVEGDPSLDLQQRLHPYGLKSFPRLAGQLLISFASSREIFTVGPLKNLVPILMMLLVIFPRRNHHFSLCCLDD